MGRVMHVLHVGFGKFLHEVIAPGLLPYLVALALAWPVDHLADLLGRWPGAGMLVAAGLLYTALTVTLLDCVALSSEERVLLRQMGRRAVATVIPATVTAADAGAGRKDG